MKLDIICNSCNEKIMKNINDNQYIYNITCLKCTKKYKIIIQSDISEILFDRGCIFHNMGLYRESILNFYGSLEKFREFLIRYYLIKQKFSDDKIKNFLKNIELSERQHGVYCFIN